MQTSAPDDASLSNIKQGYILLMHYDPPPWVLSGGDRPSDIKTMGMRLALVDIWQSLSDVRDG